jgi:hypothetical protein
VIENGIIVRGISLKYTVMVTDGVRHEYACTRHEVEAHSPSAFDIISKLGEHVPMMHDGLGLRNSRR